MFTFISHEGPTVQSYTMGKQASIIYCICCTAFFLRVGCFPRRPADIRMGAAFHIWCVSTLHTSDAFSLFNPL